MKRTWNWASSGSPARISSVTKWTPRCWGRRCNWKKEAIKMRKKLNCGQFITFRFSQAFGPMVRPEPLGSEESREAWKQVVQWCASKQGAFFSGHAAKKESLRESWGTCGKKGRNLWGKANIRSQTFYRTACLSEGGRHGSGSVSGRGSRLCRSRTRGFCTFRDVPVWCRRVVTVPVEQNWDDFKKINKR